MGIERHVNAPIKSADGLGHSGMNAWIGTLSPLDRCDGSHAASVAHTYLRACVLDGRIPAGAHINQVDLAERLGLSRTPIREAIRMLQKEGLVDAEPWKKAKVVGCDAAHLEAITDGAGIGEALARARSGRCVGRRAQPVSSRARGGGQPASSTLY
jgi:hypothetical protein